MQRNHLRAQQVLPGGDARGDLDGVLALAVDDLLGAPNAVAEAVLLDLEPAAADAGVGGRVGDLLEVGDGGALVRGVHDVGGRGAAAVEHVAPDGGDGLAGGHGDDLGGGRGRVGRPVAGHGGGGDVLDGAVVGGDSDADADAAVDAAGFEGGEDCVGGGRGGGEEGEEELHCESS